MVGREEPEQDDTRYRISVCLRRFFSDERSLCYITVVPGRRVRWLTRRLRRLFALPSTPALALICRGHLLPPDEPLSLLAPDDLVEVLPVERKENEAVPNSSLDADLNTSDTAVTRQKRNREHDLSDDTNEVVAPPSQRARFLEDSTPPVPLSTSEPNLLSPTKAPDLQSPKQSLELISPKQAFDNSSLNLAPISTSPNIKHNLCFTTPESDLATTCEQEFFNSEPQNLDEVKQRALLLLDEYGSSSLVPDTVAPLRKRRRRVRRRRTPRVPCPELPQVIQSESELTADQLQCESTMIPVVEEQKCESPPAALLSHQESDSTEELITDKECQLIQTQKVDKPFDESNLAHPLDQCSTIERRRRDHSLALDAVMVVRNKSQESRVARVVRSLSPAPRQSSVSCGK